MNPFLLASLLLASTVTTAGATDGMEVRCTEIGAGTLCKCSEPLNFSPAVQPNWGVAGADMPDSPTLTSCSGGRTWGGDGDNPANHTQVTGSTAGLSQATWVNQATVPVRGSWTDLNRTITDATICYRTYQRFGSGWPSTKSNSNDDIKQHQVECQNALPCLGNHSIWTNDGIKAGIPDPASTAFSCVNGGTDTNRCGGDIWSDSAAGKPTWQDCKNHWCRIEWCYDHNSRDDNKMVYRARQAQIQNNTGVVLKQSTWEKMVSPNSSSTAETGSHRTNVALTSMPDWGKAGDPTSQPLPVGAVMWFSHLMVAIVTDADERTGTVPANREDFWIGPAYEIEGASAPAPPAPAVPLPPDILP